MFSNLSTNRHDKRWLRSGSVIYTKHSAYECLKQTVADEDFEKLSNAIFTQDIKNLPVQKINLLKKFARFTKSCLMIIGDIYNESDDCFDTIEGMAILYSVKYSVNKNKEVVVFFLGNPLNRINLKTEVVTTLANDEEFSRLLECAIYRGGGKKPITMHSIDPKPDFGLLSGLKQAANVRMTPFAQHDSSIIHKYLKILSTRFANMRPFNKDILDFNDFLAFGQTPDARINDLEQSIKNLRPHLFYEISGREAVDAYFSVSRGLIWKSDYLRILSGKPPIHPETLSILSNESNARQVK